MGTLKETEELQVLRSLKEKKAYQEEGYQENFQRSLDVRWLNQYVV